MFRDLPKEIRQLVESIGAYSGVDAELLMISEEFSEIDVRLGAAKLELSGLEFELKVAQEKQKFAQECVKPLKVEMDEKRARYERLQGDRDKAKERLSRHRQETGGLKLVTS